MNDDGRGQVLSTVGDDGHLLIALSIQLCIQCDGRFGIRASLVHQRQLILVVNLDN